MSGHVSSLPPAHCLLLATCCPEATTLPPPTGRFVAVQKLTFLNPGEVGPFLLQVPLVSMVDPVPVRGEMESTACFMLRPVGSVAGVVVIVAAMFVLGGVVGGVHVSSLGCNRGVFDFANGTGFSASCSHARLWPSCGRGPSVSWRRLGRPYWASSSHSGPSEP